MSVGGSRLLKKELFEPLLPGARLMAGPYCYHCDFGLEYPGCALACAHELERVIQAEGPETVAAFIGEPISNSSGVSVPPPDYWPTIRAICDKYGIILICDEVITGFGRTGKMFGIEHFGIVPDILTVAKGLTSGYAPMGAAITRSEFADRFKPGANEAFQHVVTFGGHAVASAAALANLEIIEQENLVENSAEMGSYLLEGLQNLKQHPSVGDVRGLGLLCALELVRDKKTREGFSNDERLTLRRSLSKKFSDAGVYLLAGDKITLMPPLIVQKHEIDMLVNVLDRALSELESEQTWWSA
jgi:adenosylmethionine-8-amino-7-oxononanoate aminotransferase